MRIRFPVWAVPLLAATTAFGAIPRAAQMPSAEFNLSRGPAPSAPSLGGVGSAASLNSFTGAPALSPRLTPVASLPGVEMTPVLPAGGSMQGPPPGAPLARALREGFKSFLLDAMDAKPLQPPLTLGTVFFDGSRAKPEAIDPAAAARRERVPASRSPAAARHDAPLEVAPKPRALVEMNRSPGSEMVFDRNATKLLAGAEKWHDNVVKFAPGWIKASLPQAIERHMGEGYRITVSPTGKAIYENTVNGRQIVIDAGNGYFRIFQPDAPGSLKGRYLNLDGETPMMEVLTKKGRQRIPLTGGALNQATHFILESLPRTTAPPAPIQ